MLDLFCWYCWKSVDDVYTWAMLVAGNMAGSKQNSRFVYILLVFLSERNGKGGYTCGTSIKASGPHGKHRRSGRHFAVHLFDPDGIKEK
mmetsp:Transcript_1923/g.3511  ORF Transcript_1923/g.3511 Transcript_1923/m.3511 type:complete len:89 (-) Transcript_1923:245-511(-)